MKIGRPISTVLTNALMTEISEMAGAVHSTPITTKTTLEGISIPVKDTVSSLENGRSSNRMGIDSSIINAVKHDCLSIRCNLEMGLHMIAETVKEDNDFMVYGAIWASQENPNFRINVLHPLIIQALLSGDYDSLIKYDSEGTLYVYEYRSSALEPAAKVRDMLNSKAVANVADRWAELLEKIGSTVYTPNTTLTCSSNLQSICTSLRSGGAKLETQRIVFSESGNNPPLVITPLMFVTRGMIFPYYGAVLSKQDTPSTPYKSRDLMNFGSCNLDHMLDIGSWGTTCTGNFQNNVYASLRVLSNLNMSSAYHDDVIIKDAGVKPYVKVTQDISVQLMLTYFGEKWKEQVEEEIVEEEIKPSTIIEEETQEEVVVVVKKRGRPKKVVGE